MYAIDFEYDGQYLSDYGFIICHFDYSDGANVASAGSKITFEKVSRLDGKRYSLTNTKYDECITCTFDICKDPDIYELEERKITNDEYRDLMRWLNRREFLKFQAFDDERGRDTCYFDVSFNVEKISISGILYGLRLTLESDRPFGYGQEVSVDWEIDDTSEEKRIRDLSDEIGYIYPDVTITCKEAGNLSIYNSFDNRTTYIKNCSQGEIITFLGEEQIITSSSSSHDISNDFNWEFIRIGNKFDDCDNVFSFSLECDITITYAPIIKDAP